MAVPAFIASPCRREHAARALFLRHTVESLWCAHALDYRVGVLQSSGDGHNVHLWLCFEVAADIPLSLRIPG